MNSQKGTCLREDKNLGVLNQSYLQLASTGERKKKKKNLSFRGCLVCVFKQPFSVFKQHFTYFNTLFHPHVFPQIFLNNNFQFLNTHTKRALSILDCLEQTPSIGRKFINKILLIHCQASIKVKFQDPLSNISNYTIHGKEITHNKITLNMEINLPDSLIAQSISDSASTRSNKINQHNHKVHVQYISFH